MKKGFTLIEILVVIGIIIILSGIIFANYRTGERQFALLRSAYKLAQDIRMAQEMAMSIREYKGTLPKGYGVYFNLATNTQYIIYRDITEPANEKYDHCEKIETISFEKGVKIQSLRASISSPPQSIMPPAISINFRPPDPTTTLKDDSNNKFFKVEIVLELIADPSRTKKITVNNVGLIDLD